MTVDSSFVEPAEFSPMQSEDDAVGSGLLDLLARELGYDDLVIVSRTFCELPKRFAKSKITRWYALRTRANYVLAPVVAIDGCALGCGEGARYASAARDVHRHLKNGEWLTADCRKFTAEDVPRFMLEYVLSGFAER